MVQVIMVALGGAIGAVLRFAVVTGVHRFAGDQLPWGTLGANVLGSVLIGLLWAFSERSQFSPTLIAFLFIGVLGAFTTFSTFALESVDLYREGRHLAALGNVLASNLICILGAYGGLRLGGMLGG